MQQIEAGDNGNDELLKASKELVDKSNIICITKGEYKTSGDNPLI